MSSKSSNLSESDLTMRSSKEETSKPMQPSEASGRQRLMREGFWTVTGQVMAMLGLLAGVRLLTELLNPEAYGELALGMTVATLINQTVFGPLGGGALRFMAPAVEQQEEAGYFSAVIGLVRIGTVWVASAALLAVVLLLAFGARTWVTLMLAATLFAILSGYGSMLSGIQNALRQRVIVALHQGAEPWMRFMLAGLCVLWFGGSSLAALAGYAVSALLILCSQLFFFHKDYPGSQCLPSDTQAWRKRILDFSWPIAIFGIFTWMQLVSDRWALSHFSVKEEVGLYAVVFQLGYYPMSVVSGMVMQLMVPVIYQHAGDATDSRRLTKVNRLNWRLAGATLGVTLVIFGLTYALHAQLFSLLVAREYGSISYLLPWMVLAGGILAAAQTITLNMLSQMKTRELIAGKVVTAMFGVILNCAGAYWYGAAGVVVASNIFSVLLFIWMAAISMKGA